MTERGWGKMASLIAGSEKEKRFPSPNCKEAFADGA